MFMATNRYYLRRGIEVIFCKPGTLNPALLWPGRLDRRVEFSLPDNEGRAHILRIHARRYSIRNLSSIIFILTITLLA